MAWYFRLTGCEAVRHRQTPDRRWPMGSTRTIAPQAAPAQSAICGPEADSGSRGLDWHPVCAAQWHSLEHAAAANGVWVGYDVLAPSRPLATGGRLEATPPRAAGRVTPAGPTGSRARCGRQYLAPRAARGEKTGPNPTDRRKAGSKHHVLTDANGIPVVARLTAANRHDVTQLLPLIDGIPPVRGCPGRPLRKPALVQGDRGYDSQPHRDALERRGIACQLAKRGRPHGSGLGRTRWVVERTLAWLHQFRRLNLRYERRPCVHEAFLTLACAMVCWNFLKS
jgi:transposase